MLVKLQKRCFEQLAGPRNRRMTFTSGTPVLTARAANTSSLPHTQQSQEHITTSKTIYLIRHGEGFHNIGYDHNLDAHLTPRGWAQTAALQQHLTALQPHLGIQLVVVSPLRRTLETAAGVFGAQAPPATAAAAAATVAATAAGSTGPDSSNHTPWVLMNQQAGRPHEITPQAMLYLPPVPRRAVMAAAGAAAAGAAVDAAAMELGGRVGCEGTGVTEAQQEEHEPLKLLAHEGCRERIGPNVCDKFRDLDLQMADFPGVNFSAMQHSRDEAWEALHDAECHDAGCYRTGEEESACERRALEFYAWLMSRPESVIAVVSHCGFLVHGMRALGKTMFASWGDTMTLQYKANGNAPAIIPYPPPSSYPNSLAGSSSPQGSAVPPGAPFGPMSSPTFMPSPYQQPPSSPLVNPLPSAMHFSPRGVSFGPRVGPQSPPPHTSPTSQAAEALRQCAAELTGRLALDWQNCECRSIELRWASPAEILSPQAAEYAAQLAASANGKSGSSGLGAFLWARAGNPFTWFPGGSYGIMQ